ncbi:MAG: hypothetical protein GTO49_35640 [Anaerolineae bacterium]|nr:hypothetical protein [Anaerolineae bacterium]
MCPECHPPPPLVDPLTPEQWELSKQEAAIFQIPVELVAGTVAVEIVHDTQWHDPVLDFMLALGLQYHYVGQSGWVPRHRQHMQWCEVATGLLAGYEHYWGRLGGRGPGPGVTNFHIGTAKMVEEYFAQEYADWRVLDAPPDAYMRMGLLLSDPVSIHYAAAYLRHLADLRKGTGIQPLKRPHTHDLTDLDMQVIAGAFRAGVGKGKGYRTVKHFQEATTPGVEYGPLIRPFLSFYRRKLALEYGRLLRYM